MAICFNGAENQCASTNIYNIIRNELLSNYLASNAKAYMSLLLWPVFRHSEYREIGNIYYFALYFHSPILQKCIMPAAVSQYINNLNEKALLLA